MPLHADDDPRKSLKDKIAEQMAETDRPNAVAGTANDSHHGGTDDDYLTADEVCEMLGGRRGKVSRASLYRAVKLKIISAPEHPLPGISRWRRGKTRAEIDAYIAAQGRGGL